MNLTSKLSITLSLILTTFFCNGQIKNATTESVKIYGNCGMCETTIETTGNIKHVAMVDWNKDTKMATIIYDTSKTDQTEILKRIALAGYDSDLFLAPDAQYAKLPACCQYERTNKSAVIEIDQVQTLGTHEHQTSNEMMKDSNQLNAIFENYFSLKDALVKSDQKSAAAAAKDLLLNIDKVKMDKLSSEEHTVWMKVMGNLKSNTDIISASTKIEKQRVAFMKLSANFYELTKVTKQETPLYYQYCPMYNDGDGANWLSKENAIKNPYYGSQMLTCGSTVETIE